MSDDDTVEDIALQLAAIKDELLALAPGPSAERYRLLKEQDALHEKASELASDVDSERPTEELEAELESLKHRRKELVESRTGYVMGKGGSSQGPASAAWVKLSSEARTGAGLDRLNARISHIEDVLADREEGAD